MRGKGSMRSKWILQSYQQPGITPAYAGKSNDIEDVYRIKWDHPRLCGEKYTSQTPRPLHIGSPPPMRGKVVCFKKQVSGCGITPAYAGKSFFVRPRFSRSRDHPRLCGEKTGNRLKYNFTIGSPPPMRGKVQQFPDRFRFLGITPAYAGKSSKHGTISQKN